jgi:HNH endonuclease
MQLPDALPVLAKGHHPAGSGRACAMDGCSQKVRARGLCGAHYQSERVAGRLAPLTDESRFQQHVPSRPDVGCWLWAGPRYSTGYGVAVWAGARLPAHRLAMQLDGRPVPTGMDACHHCDNRLCVRPDHLYAGTRKQNMADCTERGRHNKPRGGSHWCAVLTDDQRAAMRADRLTGLSVKDLAAKYGVDPSTASRVSRGITSRPLSRSAVA